MSFAKKASPPSPPIAISPPAAAAKNARDLLALAAADITFVNAAIQTTLTVNADGLYVYLEGIKERDTGAETSIQLRWDVPSVLLSREHAIEFIYACVREAWEHELNEAMFVNGARRRDLHNDREQTKRPPEEVAAVRLEIEMLKQQLVGFLVSADTKIASY